MPKKATTPAEMIVGTTLEQSTVASENANALAALIHEDEMDAKQLAKKLGYGGSLEPVVIAQLVRLKYSVAEASFYEYSGYLALLRESTKRGNWSNQLVELGISERMAQIHISMFKRASATTSPESIMMLGYTKNKVLQTLDDEEFKELAEGASVNGITLTEVQRMSTAQLRTKLQEAQRKIKTEEDTTKAAVQRKDQQIYDLEKRLGQRPQLSREEVAEYKAKPLGILVAEQVNLSVRFGEEVKMLLETGDDLLAGQAQQALTYAVQQLLRVADEHHMPLNAAELSLDLDEYENKVLGLVAYPKEAA